MRQRDGGLRRRNWRDRRAVRREFRLRVRVLHPRTEHERRHGLERRGLHHREAAKLYAKVLTLYPSDLEMMTGLGYSELNAGRKREASKAFRTVLGIVPNHSRAREGLAACR